MYNIGLPTTLSAGHWVIDITNGHYIHAGLKRESEFLSIYQ